jgi:hypothetical protein
LTQNDYLITEQDPTWKPHPQPAGPPPEPYKCIVTNLSIRPRVIYDGIRNHAPIRFAPQETKEVVLDKRTAARLQRETYKVANEPDLLVRAIGPVPLEPEPELMVEEPELIVEGPLLDEAPVDAPTAEAAPPPAPGVLPPDRMPRRARPAPTKAA